MQNSKRGMVTGSVPIRAPIFAQIRLPICALLSGLSMTSAAAHAQENVQDNVQENAREGTEVISETITKVGGDGETRVIVIRKDIRRATSNDAGGAGAAGGAGGAEAAGEVSTVATALAQNSNSGAELGPESGEETTAHVIIRRHKIDDSGEAMPAAEQSEEVLYLRDEGEMSQEQRAKIMQELSKSEDLVAGQGETIRVEKEVDGDDERIRIVRRRMKTPENGPNSAPTHAGDAGDAGDAIGEAGDMECETITQTSELTGEEGEKHLIRICHKGSAQDVGGDDGGDVGGNDEVTRQVALEGLKSVRSELLEELKGLTADQRSTVMREIDAAIARLSQEP